MALALEDLNVLRVAESICDNLWKRVAHWGPFARDTVGKQLVEAADSIGANIAEAYGRFHFGEKLTFLYYARGSLFETKYWLNRARDRELLDADTTQAYATDLTDLAKQLNALVSVTRQQRTKSNADAKSIRDASAEYAAADDAAADSDSAADLFSPDDLVWINTA